MQGFWDNCATVNSMNKAAINSPNPRSSTLKRSPTLTLTSEFVSDATNKAKCHHLPAPPSGLSRYHKLLWSLLRAMEFSGQKQIRFNRIYKLRRGFLFAFEQKSSSPAVTTITVFDTDRGTSYLCHFTMKPAPNSTEYFCIRHAHDLWRRLRHHGHVVWK